MERSFADRLASARAGYGPLCVGLDPSTNQLQRWGLADSPEGLKMFSELCVSQLIGRVGIAKPQVAYFERFGPAGLAILKSLISELQAVGILVIADAKRGDIGSTMSGYMQAWLGEDEFSAEALTAHSYLGMDVLQESLMSLSWPKSKGVFALCATSNPEGYVLQSAVTSRGETVAKYVLQQAELASDRNGLSLGVVIGSTLRLEDYGLGEYLDRPASVPILAPGFGEQGARLEDIQIIFGASAPQVIPTLSRSLLGEEPGNFGERILVAQGQIS